MTTKKYDFIILLKKKDFILYYFCGQIYFCIYDDSCLFVEILSFIKVPYKTNTTYI